MNAKLQSVLDKVTRQTTVLQSLITLTKGLAQLVRDAKGDDAALDQLAIDIDASSDAAAAAVTENTPAADPPAPVGRP